MRNLVFIPARSGSKGIKNKNLSIVNNKSLIDYTFEFAHKIKKKYKNFDILLSTDSKTILRKTKKFNYYYNYIRPKSLSGDKSLVIDAILHGVSWYEQNFEKIENVLMLQPTNPYRIFKDFDNLYNDFLKNSYSSYVSVIKMKEHPSECIYYNKNKWNYIVNPIKKSYGRQSYDPNYFFIDGSYYLSNKKFLKKNKSFFVKKNTKFFQLSHNYPFDIDDKNDLNLIKSFKFLK